MVQTALAYSHGYSAVKLLASMLGVRWHCDEHDDTALATCPPPPPLPAFYISLSRMAAWVYHELTPSVVVFSVLVSCYSCRSFPEGKAGLNLLSQTTCQATH